MRSKGWERNKPRPFVPPVFYGLCEPAYINGYTDGVEAGADAYEEGLKKEAIHIYTAKGWEYLRESYEEWLHGNKPGYIVFIEEEVGDVQT